MSVGSLHRIRFSWTCIAGLLGSMLAVLALSACGGGGGGGGSSSSGGGSNNNAGGVACSTAGCVNINNASSIDAQISGASVGSPPVIEFRLRDDNGNPIINLPPSAISFTFAKLMPGTDGNASAWQSYVNRLDNGAVQATTESGASGILVDHGDGTYTYTFATDVTKVTNPIAVPYNASLTHRVSFEIRGFVPVDNPVYDFRPDDGATSGLFTREIVKTANCNRCHEKLALHGNARFEVQQCVSCHNPGSTDGGTGNTVDFKVMIHKIHRGEDLPSVQSGTDYCIIGFNNSRNCFGDVVFPQDIRNCSNCHDAGDPDTPDAANWYTRPTKEACGSCHDNVNFATGKGHDDAATGTGIVADNSMCAGCHTPSSSFEVRQAHRLQAQEAVKQFAFNINRVTYAAGTAPVVDFSITDPTSNNSPYDLANDPEITRSNLRFALAWNTADYFNEGSGSNPAQPARTSLVSNGVLSSAVTDNQDGTYSLPLSAIPTGTAIPITGSGAVTLEGEPVIDIGNATESVPATSAVGYFAITGDPANPTPRRQKVDINRCDNCHELLSLHGGSRNNNTSLCVTCHNPNATDVGRRPADPTTTLDGKAEEAIDFKYMIHKIHAAGIVVYGFSGAVDFRGLRYPQRLSNCTACHTDTGFYPVAFDSGVLATTISTGADLASPLDDVNITPNTAACSSCHTSSDAALHMQQNGGSFDACQDAGGALTLRVDTCGGTPGPTTAESCTVCHGPGRIADVAAVHAVD
jgi:OmcA/MtrC family decaheme c-type cytochrome